MTGLHRNLRYLVWLALGAATMAAAIAVLLVAELAQRQSLVRNMAMRTDSVTSPASELEREYLRFRHALESFLTSRQPPSEEALELQYSLFLSRVTLMRDSPSVALLAERAEYQAAMPNLEAWMRLAEPVMAHEPVRGHELQKLLEQTQALASDVHVLNIAASSQVSRLIEMQESDMLAQTNRIVALTAGVLVLLLLAFGSLLVRHQRQVREQQERRKITEDLREANQAAQIAMEKLHRSQEQLARSETKAALSTMIASVSHELNTPLGNSLLTASTLNEQGRALRRALLSEQLKRSELTAFIESMCEGNELMQRNLERAVDLLKKFRQVANDQASEKRRNFDLGQVVREVLDTLAPSLKRYPQRVAVDIPGGIAMDSFPGPLGQVVINMVNNAFLHAFEGREQGVLTVRARLSGEAGRVILVFEDDGVGMSQETQAQLFHPFFSTKQGQGGTGLGMVIVADLVHKVLGGEIQVQSTPGQGTRITVTLPLVAPQQQ